MKRFTGFLATFALVLISSTAFAQDLATAPAGAATPAAPSGLFGKGRMMVGGEISYTSGTSTMDAGGTSVDTDYSTLKFAPTFGYFVIPNIAVIGQLTYQSDSMGDSDQSTVGLSVGARYYMAMGKFNVYGGGMLGYSSVDYGGDTTASGFVINIHGGALYMLGANWGVDAGLQIVYATGEMENSGSTADISDLSFALGYFGVQVFF
jgi:Outer membrane protein beta-barrel domain